MKKIFILICTLFIAVNVSAQTRKVGDVIMINGEFGVVFAVTTDGQHGKAVSVSTTKCNWNDAAKWCANYGRGWRLPTKDELHVIYRNKAVINSALKINGYTMLEHEYWASEIYNNGNNAWSVYMFNGNTCSLPKDFDIYVRAVTVF